MGVKKDNTFSVLRFAFSVLLVSVFKRLGAFQFSVGLIVVLHLTGSVVVVFELLDAFGLVFIVVFHLAYALGACALVFVCGSFLLPVRRILYLLNFAAQFIVNNRVVEIGSCRASLRVPLLHYQVLFSFTLRGLVLCYYAASDEAHCKDKDDLFLHGIVF